MPSIIKVVVCVLLFFSSIFSQAYAISSGTINFSVSPTKYELELQPWESVTLPASIRNNGTTTVTMPITASDFQANGVGGVPSIVRRSELVYPDQELAAWISFADPSVTLAPWEKWTIDFTIDVPVTATPGWHYGAVLFQNDNSVWWAPWKIAIDVDYGIIILATVSGDVIVDVGIGSPRISWWGTSTNADVCEGWDESWSIYDGTCEWNYPWYVWNNPNWEPEYIYPDSCPFGDFTPSRYDGKCIWSVPEENEEEKSEESWEENNSDEDDNKDDFNVEITIPIDNNGNTHIKPEGKIVLKDEDGNIIKAIGKKAIVNDRWAVIWQEIVDYIPINDQWWNILPKTKRIYESEWKGFPYKGYDDEGNQIINFWTPSEYYTNKNKEESGFLMFWERVSEIRQHKTITAEIEIVYYDEDGNPVEFTTATEFPVQYIEQKVTVNPYIVLALLLLSTVGLMSWFAVKWWIVAIKKKSCWNCGEQIKSQWSACPHCKSLQNKKKQKALEELKSKSKASPAKTRKTAPAKRKASTKKTK